MESLYTVVFTADEIHEVINAIVDTCEYVQLEDRLEYLHTALAKFNAAETRVIHDAMSRLLAEPS